MNAINKMGKCCIGIGLLAMAPVLFAGQMEIYNVQVCVGGAATQVSGLNIAPLAPYAHNSQFFASQVKSNCNVYTYQTSTPANIPRLISITFASSPTVTTVAGATLTCPNTIANNNLAFSPTAGNSVDADGNIVWVANKTLMVSVTQPTGFCGYSGKTPCNTGPATCSMSLVSYPQ
jgi:hypothetical protein